MQQQSSSTWAALAGWEMYFLFFFAATLYWLWNHPGNQNESSSSQFQQSTIKLNLSSSGQQRSVLPLCFASTFYWPWNHPGNQKERDKMKVFPHCSINKTSMIIDHWSSQTWVTLPIKLWQSNFGNPTWAIQLWQSSSTWAVLDNAEYFLKAQTINNQLPSHKSIPSHFPGNRF